jgi:hypothetical protein
MQARYNETFMVDIKNAGYAMALVGKIVNSMGPMCSKDPIVPAGFNVSDGDKCVPQPSIVHSIPSIELSIFSPQVRCDVQ